MRCSVVFGVTLRLLVIIISSSSPAINTAAYIVLAMCHNLIIAISAYTTCIRRPRQGGSRQNIAMPCGTEKLEWCGYPTGQKIEDTFIRFDLIVDPRTRHTHTHTHTESGKERERERESEGERERDTHTHTDIIRKAGKLTKRCKLTSRPRKTVTICRPAPAILRLVKFGNLGHLGLRPYDNDDITRSSAVAERPRDASCH